MKNLMCILFVLLLFGCGTTGKDIKTNVDITISNNTGTVTIAPDLATESGPSDATSNNSPDVDVPVTVPIDVSNPVSQLDTAVKAATGASLLSTASDLLSTSDDVPVIENEPPSKTVATDTYTMEYRPEHDRSFVWLNKTGADFKPPVTFTIPECDNYSFVVDDPTNDKQTQEGIYFCGTNNKPEESNGDKASFFSPSGCHATELLVSESM